MILATEQRQKLDTSNDVFFYDYPRFVTHVDDGFIEQLTALYGELLTPNSRVLDLMSSWVSHLPEDITFDHVEGHGMNAEELQKNARLDHFFTQNLNVDLKLPLEDQSFDAVLIAVSVQYLQYPEAIFTEIQRVLTPGGLCIVSFSNRMFYQKAIAAWRDSSDSDHIRLVKRYFSSTEGFADPQAIARPAQLNNILQMIGMGNRDPFYAVVAQKV